MNVTGVLFSMNRQDFKELSRIRQREARTLLDARCWHGAYYLIGYSVECALKACIAKNTRRFDFPDKETANKVFTHNLEALMGLAGLAVSLESDRRTSPVLGTNWMIVRDWKESVRYERLLTEELARGLYSACVSSRNGILSWIRKKW